MSSRPGDPSRRPRRVSNGPRRNLRRSARQSGSLAAAMMTGQSLRGRRLTKLAHLILLTVPRFFAASSAAAMCFPTGGGLVQEFEVVACVEPDTASILESVHQAFDAAEPLGRHADLPNMPTPEAWAAHVIRQSSGAIITGTVSRSRPVDPSRTDPNTGKHLAATGGAWQTTDQPATYLLRSTAAHPCGSLPTGTTVQLFVAPPCCDVAPAVTVACLQHFSEASQEIPLWAAKVTP